jgi:virulence factor Mce-like protein
MNRSRVAVNAVLLAVFAAVCIGGMEYLALNIGQGNPLASNYTVHATFPDADGIPTAADVRVSGVVVGKVTAISHDAQHTGQSIVTMEITDSRAVPVYTNGFAKIKPKTLLGEKYVDLTIGNPGTASGIEAGGYLPASQASKDVSNDEIFNAFDATARQQQQQVLADLNRATQGRAGDIQSELPNVQRVFDDLLPVARMYEQDQKQVDDIFVNLNTILKTTADEHEQLAGLFANGNIALGAVARRNDALISTLQEFSNVATEFNAAAQPTIAAQRQALAELGPTLGSENALLDEVEGANPRCGGRSCGIDEVFTGTLLGNVNYPNDQLTVTSSDGTTVTNEWASMFSQPTNDHRALNLVLSFHCDTLTQTLHEIAANLTADQVAATEAACNAAIFHGQQGSHP